MRVPALVQPGLHVHRVAKACPRVSSCTPNGSARVSNRTPDSFQPSAGTAGQPGPSSSSQPEDCTPRKRHDVVVDEGDHSRCVSLHASTRQLQQEVKDLRDDVAARALRLIEHMSRRSKLEHARRDVEAGEQHDGCSCSAAAQHAAKHRTERTRREAGSAGIGIATTGYVQTEPN